MNIETYKPEYKEAFIAMNLAWIEEMFQVEDEDRMVLGSIEERLANGGEIFFAINDEGEIMASCMVAPLPSGEWEIEKFAAKKEFAGQGAGKACLQACMDFIKEKQIQKVIIVSNRKCVSAIHLYRKFGFIEIPVDKNKFPYERADIAFEQYF
ncbi:GNAT family N-acetyltransferase [Streptococcus suis]|jgi:ribosomal protein S18 acetylase RimI-like enzyme|uniref:GNAT family N-acetyltransferase n=3 Tax=Streptococcus TaxID=1301 RepID=A0A0Z8TJ18_STRSU|nr:MULTISPECIES: GNAT family N-acetyltransferase [Streptococcus]AWL25206.1 GNAT family N-acetyltransferase [Streptococcus suis]MBL6503352.1 GNAT family N-acetyltransferase [Streptococcus suis]MBM0242412.1 GNAT family N-acetyltransferase [Streptococcus suis]MBM7136352.1 GNAT family N-acetyltransferase [Streptococcus suis]MBM7138486.1 GNAT family N-acetyltransferase [Streptococcus suis]